jgi:DNA-binding winged helix-turn-helix (wHTH) protein
MKTAGVGRHTSKAKKGAVGRGLGKIELEVVRGGEMSTPASRGVVTFGDFRFDFRRGALFRAGVAVHLEPRVAELLGLLIHDAGRLVSRDDLRARLWPTGDGSDDALNYLVGAARRALCACPGRPIAMVRGRGYRFDAPCGGIVHEAERRPLYDRSAELQELRRLAASCVAGKITRFALVSGAPGIGKTRLAEQVSMEWADRGFRVLLASCCEGERAPSLWPWHCLLRDIGAAQALPDTGDDSALPSTERYRYYAVVRRELERAAQGGPLLVVLEDLHRADDATLGLLRFVTETARPVPIFYVTTSRTPLVPPNAGAIEALARHGHALSLGALGTRGAERLLRNVLGDERFPELESEALQQAGGNPLFLRELALAMRTRPHRALEFLRSSSPSAIRDSIRWHLAILDEPARGLLTVASVLGDEFDMRWLAAVLDRDITRALADLADAVRLELLRPVSPFDFAFCHKLYRLYLYEATPEVERRAFHWKIGTRMLEGGQERSARGLSQIAHHLAAGAVAATQAALASRLSRRSADACVERLAFETAAGEYRRTLRLAEAADAGVSERIELLLRAADCHRLLGRQVQADAFSEEATTLARATGVPVTPLGPADEELAVPAQ